MSQQMILRLALYWRRLMYRLCGRCLVALALLVVLVSGTTLMAQTEFITEAQIQALLSQYTEEQGTGQVERFERGVRQAAGRWREADGTAEEFAAFCRDQFIADPVELQQTADRLEAAFESIYGHLGEMGRDLYWNLSVDTGPILPIDNAIARFSPYSHVNDDLFETRIAFIVLLNYPLYSLDEMLEYGPSWSRDEWAQVRMVQRFTDRVPAEVSQVTRDAGLAAGNYIRDYNIWMHHLLDENGDRPFPEGMRLISHWNLRDELKSLYAEADGLPRQAMIYDVMTRIIRQEVPEVVVNNPGVDWNLSTNEVVVSDAVDGDLPRGWEAPGKPGAEVDNTPEPDTRYERFLGIFKAQQVVDQYYPKLPTLIDRRFQRMREIPEEKVEALFVSILSSDLLDQTAALIQSRLGRPLRPFDIWYDGFKARSAISEEKLDSIVKKKYPTAEAFEADMPNILTKLGFDLKTAHYLSSRIEVDPSRGAGHASGPGRRVDKARLRTRVGADGMDYKGYHIAAHELGHNVEQVFSTCRIDHTELAGVPNTAFTEGFAFVFQERDLELLGIPDTSSHAEDLRVLDNYWSTCEIAAVSLVDMRAWRWMYEHPEATAAELKEAVIEIAQDVWNEYYAPAIGVRDAEILAVYSHMISGAMYLPDYPLGHIIEFQVKEYLGDRLPGEEMERMCLLGSITPDLWMQNAVGAEISSEPMLSAARVALTAMTE